MKTETDDSTQEASSLHSLARCPFCGDYNSELADSEVPTIRGNQKSAVFCNTCFCEGPTANCESDAVEMWNRRAPNASKSGSPSVVTCVYCGHEYPEGTPTAKHDLLTAHIKDCDKHPMRDADWSR